MVHLQHYDSVHFDDLNAYNLSEVQSDFTASVFENIVNRNVNSNPNKYPITIFFGEKPIGFFVLDLSEEISQFTQDTNSIVLRSLSLNPEYQGMGYGKIALLKCEPFVLDNFPNIHKIVLAVNFRNQLAIELYKKLEYQDTGKIIIGPKGPQHIFEKILKNQESN